MPFSLRDKGTLEAQQKGGDEGNDPDWEFCHELWNAQ